MFTGRMVLRESLALETFQTVEDKTLVPEDAKACSTEVCGCDPVSCLVPSFPNPDFYHHSKCITY